MEIHDELKQAGLRQKAIEIIVHDGFDDLSVHMRLNPDNISIKIQ